MKLRSGEWLVVAGSALIVLLAAFTGSAIYLKPPPAVYAYEESPATQHGEAIYRREGCGSCHKVFGTGATYGPSLDGEGSRRTREWLHAYLLDPRPGVGVKPYRLKMPSYGKLKLEERDALVAYLQALRTPDAAEATDSPGPVAQRPQTGSAAD